MNRTSNVDVAALRASYLELNMPGMVELIDFLSSEKGSQCNEIGSSSIGPYGTGVLYLGRPRANPPETPLESIQLVLPTMPTILQKYGREGLDKLDKVMGSFAQWAQAKPSGDSMLFREDGEYRLTPEEYAQFTANPDMDLEPFRVKPGGRTSVWQEETDALSKIRIGEID